jgi:hypothetical protein
MEAAYCTACKMGKCSLSASRSCSACPVCTNNNSLDTGGTACPDAGKYMRLENIGSSTSGPFALVNARWEYSWPCQYSASAHHPRLPGVSSKVGEASLAAQEDITIICPDADMIVIQGLVVLSIMCALYFRFDSLIDHTSSKKRNTFRKIKRVLLLGLASNIVAVGAQNPQFTESKRRRR